MTRFRPHKMYPGALLAQEVCSYEATTQLLAGMQGDLAVIIHSDRDCSNVLPKTRGIIAGERDYKFFCTNMREDEIVTGQGNAKLRRSIELIHEAYSPSLIIVLSTCPTVMIGDNLKNVARKAGRDLGANVVAEVTHGLRPKSPAEVVDDCYSMLCRGAKPVEGLNLEKRVNLVGLGMLPSERAEIESTLTAMGLELNVVLNDQSNVKDFLGVAGARWNVHPGPNMLLELDEQCAEKLQMKAIEVPLPFGVAATDRFYEAIAKATGVDDATWKAAVAPLRDPALLALSEFKAKLTEKIQAEKGRAPRCVHNVGSVSTIDLRRIALEEMGEVPLLEEMGFAVTLFIQGPRDTGNEARTAGVLKEMGATSPFVIFPDPGSLAKLIQPGDFDFFLGADFLLDQLTRVNLPLLPKNEIGMGYGRVAANVRRVEEVVFTRFYQHFATDNSAPTHLPVVQGPQPLGGCRV